MGEHEYKRALTYSRAGYSVNLKRDIDEIFINSYNPEWLRAWNANIDIQPCFDHFGVITYCTEYFVKDETGTMEVLKQVFEDNPDDTTKEKMKKIASTFLSHRQIGEAEAFYKLLPDLLLKNSNVSCQWLFLGTKEDKQIRMKRAEDGDKQKNLIKLVGVEGLWYEQPDMLSKYKRRPDEIEEMCSSHFGKMITFGGKEASFLQREEENQDDEVDDQDDEELEGEFSDQEDPNDKFHYIITSSDERGKEIPNFIKLKDPPPKENPIMRKRSFPAALRFHKPKEEQNPHKYFLSELMLYIPFRDEEAEFKPNNPEFLEEMYMKNKEKIQKVKSKVMEHLESVEEARHYVEEVTKKLDIKNVGIQLDSMMEQSNADCQDDSEELHPDYLHLDIENAPEMVENNQNRQSIYRRMEIPDIKDLKAMTRQLLFSKKCDRHWAKIL